MNTFYAILGLYTHGPEMLNTVHTDIESARRSLAFLKGSYNRNYWLVCPEEVWFVDYEEGFGIGHVTADSAREHAIWAEYTEGQVVSVRHVVAGVGA